MDDDAPCGAVLRRILAPSYVVTEAHNAELALDLVIAGHRFDVVVCDMRLDGWSGADLYRRLGRRCDPHTGCFVILSGQDVPADHPALAAELGSRLLAKPISPAALLDTLAAVRARSSP